MIVAVHPDNFLGNIRIRFHILTVRRNLNSQVIPFNFRCKVQVIQDSYNLFIRNFNSQNSIDTFHTDCHFFRLHGISGRNFYMSRAYLTTAKLLYQMQSPLHCHNRCVLIHTLGKHGTGIGCLSQGTGTFSDIVPGKFCRFKYHFLCGVKDFRI